MNGLVLDLIKAYEERVVMVENLVAVAWQVTAGSEEGLVQLQREREELKGRLREVLAKRCSLRRKDFNKQIERVLADSERKRKKIEEEQKRFRECLKEYLEEQKRLAASLREELDKVAGGMDQGGVEAAVASFKAACQDKGNQVLSILRSFQLRLLAFQKEEEEMNRTLGRLAEKSEFLRIEDLRRLEVAGVRQERIVAMKLRQEEVQRLLAQFGQERREGSRRS